MMFGQPDLARRVLITGTRTCVLRYMARGLALAGYDVETASTQDEACFRAAFRPPDALILEVDMPTEARSTSAARSAAGATPSCC